MLNTRNVSPTLLLASISGFHGNPQSQAAGRGVRGRFGGFRDRLLRAARVPGAEPPALQADDGCLRRVRACHGGELSLVLEGF